MFLPELLCSYSCSLALLNSHRESRLNELEPIDGNMQLPPLRKRPLVHLLMDEEAVNFRSSNLCSGPLRMRCFPTPESSHPQWNDCSRSLVSSTLKATLLKATLLVNHFKGPFRSQTYAFDLQEAARRYLKDTRGSQLHTISESWSEDMGFSDVKQLTEQEFMDTPGVRNRLPAVP